MPSLLPGYEYDLFISYRQKDNKGDKWVTEFVQALKTELEATIKEDVTIYFDQNPHDGLLESHQVDKSLEGKLKCLIFIPILSQTYCDPKSFAWQHEFCVFNKRAQQDPMGRDIRLADGNFSSRILPVIIHNLDPEDKAIIEAEVGGVLRGIEFVYREPGVNRPLKETDSPEKNLNKTLYRNQVNKVANAVKTILAAIKRRESQAGGNQQTPKFTTTAQSRPRAIFLLMGVALICGLLWVLWKFYPTQAASEPSVAVLVFKDLSPEKNYEWFTDGLTDEVANTLTQFRGIQVAGRSSAYYFKNRVTSIEEIASRLGVEHIIEGSVQVLGAQMKITATLVRAHDARQLWSQTYNRTTDDLFEVQVDIARNVAAKMNLMLNPNVRVKENPTNPAAYTEFLKGNFFHERIRHHFRETDFEKAKAHYEAAIRLDPSFGEAIGELANLFDTYALTNTDAFRKKRDSLTKVAIRLSPQSKSVLRVMVYSYLNREKPNHDSAFYYLQKVFALYPKDAWVNKTAGDFYYNAGLTDWALQFFLAAAELDPLSPTHIQWAGQTQLILGNLKEGELSAEKSLELDSGSLPARSVLLLAAITRMDTTRIIEGIQWIKRSNPSVMAFGSFIDGPQLALEGKKEEALNSCRGPSDQILVYHLLKEYPEMMVALESAIQIDPTYSYAELLNSPLYAPIRRLPEFQQLLNQLKIRDEKQRRKYKKLG